MPTISPSTMPITIMSAMIVEVWLSDPVSLKSSPVAEGGGTGEWVAGSDEDGVATGLGVAEVLKVAEGLALGADGETNKLVELAVEGLVMEADGEAVMADGEAMMEADGEADTMLEKEIVKVGEGATGTGGETDTAVELKIERTGEGVDGQVVTSGEGEEEGSVRVG